MTERFIVNKQCAETASVITFVHNNSSQRIMATAHFPPNKCMSFSKVIYLVETVSVERPPCAAVNFLIPLSRRKEMLKDNFGHFLN